MINTDLLPKRIRRCEVSDLIFLDELLDVRASLRAIYDTLLVVSRRLPPATLGSTPADLLMLPPWYEAPKTANLLPFPAGIDIEKPGLGALRFKLASLAAEELAAFRAAQNRIADHKDTLLKREKERDAILKKGGIKNEGPTL